MAKELCKHRKTTLKQDVRAYMQLVNQPTHICTKCGRAANSKKLLCHPEKIQG